MTAKKSSVKNKETKIVSRPKPSAPRAGFRVDGSRYERGGKISRKKVV